MGKAPFHDNVLTKIVKFMNGERKQELLDIVNQAKKQKKLH